MAGSQAGEGLEKERKVFLLRKASHGQDERALAGNRAVGAQRWIQAEMREKRVWDDDGFYGRKAFVVEAGGIGSQADDRTGPGVKSGPEGPVSPFDAPLPGVAPFGDDCRDSGSFQGLEHLHVEFRPKGNDDVGPAGQQVLLQLPVKGRVEGQVPPQEGHLVPGKAEVDSVATSRWVVEGAFPRVDRDEGNVDTPPRKTFCEKTG